ncbi:MAG TPA: SRPBCC family protein [Candidatus Limnocylindrales bacterium]|nr:SRPBCC family protein [Candidatus Limnocylindrales bacterium]
MRALPARTPRVEHTKAPYSLRQIGQGGAVTSHIHATVTIDTPVEKVLEFIDDPAGLAKCAPMVERVVDVVRTGRRVGDSFRVIFRVLGMTFNEEFRVVGFEPPRRYTPHRRFQIWQTLHGRVRGTVTWTLEAEGNQTYASLDATYQLMGGVFGRALDALVVERAVKKDVDQMLEEMKRQLAGQTSAAPRHV